jgi:alpha-D-xyloside xylohydrolase
MKSLNKIQAPSLRHQPLGEQHPYEPLPYERFPRYPCAGEPVVLGLETGKTPPAETVWCEWYIDGKQTNYHTEATLSAQSETADYWQVSLPAYKPYECVHYRLFAEHEGKCIESEDFSFSVSAWVEAISVIGYQHTNDRLSIKLMTTRSGLFVQLEVTLSATNTLTFLFSTAKDGAEFQKMRVADLPVNFRSAGLSLRIQSQPFKLEITRECDGLRLESVSPLRMLVDENGRVSKFKLGFTSPSDESFYGFGERFNAFNQRGNHLDNYVYGQYTNQEKRSYVPIPFFISSRGFGAWLNTEQQAEFDLAAAQPDRWMLTGQTEQDHARMEMLLFFHTHPKAIIKAFTDLVGKPQLPPSWVFGPWMSSNDWNNQVEVLYQLHKSQELGIPATVLVIEAWSDEINFYIWNDAKYTLKHPSQGYSLADFTFPAQGHWPNPQAMVDEIHRAGLHLVLWQNPTIKQRQAGEPMDEGQNSVDQAYAIQQDFVVKRADGSPHRAEEHMPWFRDSLVLDFTNPQAAAWWFKKRQYLVAELGVDGFKTDGGEHIWDITTRFFNGMRGNRGINHYPLAYEEAYQRFMQEQRGNDHILFSRAGYTGAQRYSCHWAGDENSTWQAFRASVRAILNAGISGIPFDGWDMAGFAGSIPSSELYLRAAAFSVFCPIMQYHSDVNHQRLPSRDRTPWNIQDQTGDGRVITVYCNFTNLRMNLMPYILGQAYESSQSGLPLMRALPIEFPGDAACRKYPYEYLFGEALLVAPVVEEGVTSWPVYLPAGEWRELWSGAVHQGPSEILVDMPLERIPVFQKKGSLIPLNLDASGQLGSPVGNSTSQFNHLTLRVFPGGKSTTKLIQANGSEPVEITVVESEDDDMLALQIPMLNEDVDLEIFGSEPSSVSVAGKPLSRLEINETISQIKGWQWISKDQMTRVHLLKNHTSCILMVR